MLGRLLLSSVLSQYASSTLESHVMEKTRPRHCCMYEVRDFDEKDSHDVSLENGVIFYDVVMVMKA